MTPLTSSIRYVWSLLSLVSELCKVCELSCHGSVSSTRYRYRYVNSPVLSLVSELYKVPVCELSCHWGQWALQGTGMWTLLSLVNELYKVPVCELSCHWSVSSTSYVKLWTLLSLVSTRLAMTPLTSSTSYVNSPVIGQWALQGIRTLLLLVSTWLAITPRTSSTRYVGSFLISVWSALMSLKDTGSYWLPSCFVSTNREAWHLLAALLFCFHQKGGRTLIGCPLALFPPIGRQDTYFKIVFVYFRLHTTWLFTPRTMRASSIR